MIESTPTDYATTREAGTALGVSNKTVERWADSGRIEGATKQEWPGRSGFRWIVPKVWVAAEKRRRARAARKAAGQ